MKLIVYPILFFTPLLVASQVQHLKTTTTANIEQRASELFAIR